MIYLFSILVILFYVLLEEYRSPVPEFLSQLIDFVVDIGIFCSTIVSFCLYVLLKGGHVGGEEERMCLLTCLYSGDKTLVDSSG